jgi:maltose alpha-D-glucosyltransferase / alpha-amylase
MAWYKDAVVYEVNARAFGDANGDGVGDFKGLASRLDYLRDLGVTALWLLPFYPSPLKDDGYDISDYRDVHPSYGTLDDFKDFLAEAHRRGLKVITELVLNHTSDRHPWFERARRAAPGSPEREFYVWSDTPEKYRDARVIFKDFEHSNWAWDPVAKAYYWHRFYSHQPDLNWENPFVKEAMFAIVDFWLGMGVDGLRLDAVPYLYEREGTSCENLPETHALLKELRARVDSKFEDRMLLAEANQWPEDAVSYFGGGKGDECHCAFHFPLMPRMFMAVQTEDRFPIVDILEQTPAIPETAQWLTFLRNHDELTLEMVTDEERDYMYRMYADDPQARINLGIRRRLAPLLGNNRRKIELLNGLLFSLPGTPVLYYGDEIGMGDNFYLGDRNGVRTPMQWSADRNAGFSQANAQRLYLPVIIDPEYHYEAVNVDVQQNNPHSLLWWMKRLIALRRRNPVFGSGSFQHLSCDNRKIFAFARRHEGKTLLVVANLSRFVQHAELWLPEDAGKVPVEAIGRAEFPVIGEGPYSLTLGPHEFYWFFLRPAVPSQEDDGPPVVLTNESWEELLQLPARVLEDALAAYAKRRGWARGVRGARVEDLFQLGVGGAVAVADIDTVEGAQRMAFSLAFVSGERAAELSRLRPEALIATVAGPKPGLLVEGVVERDFCAALTTMARSRVRIKGRAGELCGGASDDFPADDAAEGAVEWDDAGNASARRGRTVIKLLRRLEPGVSPELEVGRFLTAKKFPYSLPLVGAAELARGRHPSTVAVFHAALPGETYAWGYATDALRAFFERCLATGARPSLPDARLVELAQTPPPPEAYALIGPFLRDAELLGTRVAELHCALAGDANDPSFFPEPFTWQYQRSLYQSLRTLAREMFARLRRASHGLSPASRREAERAIALEEEVLSRFHAVYKTKLDGLRIRCHGDMHLGKIIHTGKDFLFTGFDGEPGRSLGEKRVKRSPLYDVAALLRSLHFCASTTLKEAREQDAEVLSEWTRYWAIWTSAAFLRHYLLGASPLVPRGKTELNLLLGVQLVARASREIMAALQAGSKPDAALRGLGDLVALAGTSGAVQTAKIR